MSSTLSLIRKRQINEENPINTILREHGYHDVTEIHELVLESPSFFELDLFFMNNSEDDFLDRDTLIRLHHELSEILTKGTKETYDVSLDAYNFNLDNPDVVEILKDVELAIERALADSTLTGLYYS
jgi:hypothetical protein